MLAGRHGDEDRTLLFDPTSFAWLEGIRRFFYLETSLFTTSAARGRPRFQAP